MSNWTPARIETLRRLIEDGYTQAQAAKRMGVSRATISGAVRRLLRGVDDWAARKGESQHGRWTEDKLTETWAERKARLAQERAHAHPV